MNQAEQEIYNGGFQFGWALRAAWKQALEVLLFAGLVKYLFF